MMQGHFGAALLISAISRRSAPLAHLFVASQIQDLLIALLVYILHIEEVRFATTDENKVFPIELIYIPYSHGLFSTVLIAVLCLALPYSQNARLALSAAVLSHWLLDFLVHLPDLDLCFPFANCGMAGLGLWRYLIPSVVVESAIILGGAALYLYAAPSAVSAKKSAARLLPLIAFMVLVTVVVPFAPPPPKLDWTIAMQTYVTYGLFVGLALLIERPMLVAGSEQKRA